MLQATLMHVSRHLLVHPWALDRPPAFHLTSCWSSTRILVMAVSGHSVSVAVDTGRCPSIKRSGLNISRVGDAGAPQRAAFLSALEDGNVLPRCEEVLPQGTKAAYADVRTAIHALLHQFLMEP